jgi:type 1 fimbria pilin
MKSMSFGTVTLLVLAVCFTVVGGAAALETNMSFNGILIEDPSCVLNNNQPIMVDFGDVVISEINGVNYTQPVEYTLSCEAKADKAMKLMIYGSAAPFNSSALATNKTNKLAIIFQANNSKLSVNNWVNFTYPEIPKLTATPIKKSDATLKAGKFSAGATMMMDFQ